MEIKINELSAKTFNWLGMNESVVKDVPEFECGSMVVTTPDEVTCEREIVDSIALSGIDKVTSGMGRDIDELISDSGVNSFVLKTKPGITSSKPAIVKVPADAGTINSNAAKQVFEAIFDEDIDVDRYVEEKGLKQVNDEGALKATVEKVIAENPQSVADYKAGKEKAIGFLVGQTMKAMQGKANPGMVNSLLKELLNK